MADPQVIHELSEPELAFHAQARIRKALTHIQQSQNELGHACSELSALVGGVTVWRRTSKLYDSVRALWYQVEGFRANGRYKLDQMTVEAIQRNLGMPKGSRK